MKSRITFDEQDEKNLIAFTNDRAPGVVEIMSKSGATIAIHEALGDFDNNNPQMIFTSCNEIEVQNNNRLTIVDSPIHLSTIIATSGTINLHNSFVGHELMDHVGHGIAKSIVYNNIVNTTESDISIPNSTVNIMGTDITVVPGTDITIGSNSTVNVTGADLCIGTLILDQNSTLNFTHNNHNYHIQTQIGVIEDNAPDIIEDNTQIEIQNIDQSLTIYELANDKYKTNTPFAINEICHIKAYQKLDPNFVNLFTGQNEMADVSTIDKFIGRHYMHYTAVAKDNNLPGSLLEGAGPYDVLGEICSWLDLSDVVLSDVVLTDEPGDIDILIGNSNLNQCLFD